ncbi:DoxX family protein [Ekhidna sp.]|uniref:DoxX family protein n=1 Tax=Ekhidna sp. TaxID=2608089 RepID=UPI00329817EB
MKNKFKRILTWTLQVLMGLEFLIAGQAKFTAAQAWFQKFNDWGFPDHFYQIIGGLEIIGAILIFIPKFASKAALGLGAIMLGATITHAVHGEWNRIIFTLIIAGILGAVFLLRKND